MPRTHPIASRSFLPSGTPLNEAEVIKRSNEFMKDLEIEIPSLTKLIASEVFVSFTSTQSGLLWVATLQESDQMSLFHQSGKKDTDIFAQEVDLIEYDKRSIKARLLVASSAATHPTLDKRSAALRKAAKSARTRRINEIISKEHALNSTLHNLEFRKLLPTGEIIFAKFTIEQLNRAYARIKVIGGADIHPKNSVINSQNIWTLERGEPLGSPEIGMKLAHAMDTQSHVSGKLAVVFDWTDGLPAFLQPIEVVFSSD